MAMHRLRALAAVTVFALISPSQARAFVITWGEAISHIGSVTPENQPAVGSEKVGFKWSYWGLLWIDLFTYDGTYCLYEGKRYVAIDPEDAARLLGKSTDELGKPFLYRVPLGWLILAPLIVIFIVAAVLDRRHSNKVRRLFDDTAYQEALAIVRDEFARQKTQTTAALDPGTLSTSDDGSRFRIALEAGVQHLVSNGKLREEAERNLTIMLNSLAHSGGKVRTISSNAERPPN